MARRKLRLQFFSKKYNPLVIKASSIKAYIAISFVHIFPLQYLKHWLTIGNGRDIEKQEELTNLARVARVN